MMAVSHDDLGEDAARPDRRINPQRNGDHDDDERSSKHQLKSSHQLVEDHLEGRSLEEIGGAQIPLHCVLQEAAVFHQKGVVEAHLVAQLLAHGLGDGLSHHMLVLLRGLCLGTGFC